MKRNFAVAALVPALALAAFMLANWRAIWAGLVDLWGTGIPLYAGGLLLAGGVILFCQRVAAHFLRKRRERRRQEMERIDRMAAASHATRIMVLALADCVTEFLAADDTMFREILAAHKRNELPNVQGGDEQVALVEEHLQELLQAVAPPLARPHSKSPRTQH